MIDNTNVKQNIPYLTFKSDILNDKWQEVRNPKTTYLEAYEFRYRNITAKYHIDDEVLMIMGSWTKLAIGHNIRIASLVEIVDAINSLSDMIGVDIWKSKVTRLEFGINVILLKAIRKYNHCLKKHIRSTVKRRSMENEQTISFATQRYEYRFYDKVAEAKKNKYMKHQVEEQAGDNNILRYEVLIPKEMSYTFGRDLKASDLVDPDLWDEMLDRLYEAYMKDIIKCACFDNTKKIKTPTDLKNLLVSIANFFVIKEDINIDWEDEELTPQQKTALRKTIREIPASEYSVKDPLVVELDNKIRSEINRIRMEVQEYRNVNVLF